MVPGFGVSVECQSIGTIGKKQRACQLAQKTLSWCQSIGTSGKKQRACYLAPKIVWCLGQVPKHRNHWQEVEVLLFSPQKSQLVYILRFHSQDVVSLFIFPTGPAALDSEPRRRRYVKNMIYNRNHLYSRAIHCPASMEKHYVQWFHLKSVQDITVCQKNQIFSS